MYSKHTAPTSTTPCMQLESPVSTAAGRCTSGPSASRSAATIGAPLPSTTILRRVAGLRGSMRSSVLNAEGGLTRYSISTVSGKCFWSIADTDFSSSSTRRLRLDMDRPRRSVCKDVKHEADTSARHTVLRIA